MLAEAPIHGLHAQHATSSAPIIAVGRTQRPSSTRVALTAAGCLVASWVALTSPRLPYAVTASVQPFARTRISVMGTRAPVPRPHDLSRHPTRHHATDPDLLAEVLKVEVVCPSDVLTHPRKKGILDELTHPEVLSNFDVYSPEVELNYIIRGVIGKGAFGEVLRVYDKQTGLYKALKRIPMFGSFALKTVTTEVAASRQMGRQPFVVNLDAAYVSNTCDNFILVYELCDESLTSWINRAIKKPSFMVDYGKPVVTDTHVRFAQDLILGLESMHRSRIIHRDLKPDNILIKDGHVKLGDFGVALVNRTSNRQAVIGDVYFMDQASLVQGNMPPDYTDDIYSMGQVFSRMFYGRYANAGELIAAVERKQELRLRITTVEDLIYQMTRPRPDRISYADMRQHPLFYGKTWIAP